MYSQTYHRNRKTQSLSLSHHQDEEIVASKDEAIGPEWKPWGEVEQAWYGLAETPAAKMHRSPLYSKDHTIAAPCQEFRRCAVTKCSVSPPGMFWWPDKGTQRAKEWKGTRQIPAWRVELLAYSPKRIGGVVPLANTNKHMRTGSRDVDR